MPTDPMWCFENYGEAAEYIDQLEKQRDELLAALREIAEWTERYTTPGHPISTVARAAIAKAEG